MEKLVTERVNSLFVILEQDIREDEIKQIINLLRQIRGVSGVRKHIKDHFEEAVARSRIRTELQMKIWRLFEEGNQP